MWLLRLGHKKDTALPGSLRTLALETQVPCCVESQTSPHGEAQVKRDEGPQLTASISFQMHE